MAKIIVSKLLKDEQLELCKLLIKADCTVRLTTVSQNGKKLTAVEYSAGETKDEQR